MKWIKSTDTAKLPTRVRDAIRRQEDETERLISWVQLGVVVTFGVLYWISPKADIAFDIIPWALATYLVLTIIRVIWSHRAHLPDWSLAFSILFDIGLLMALIWSFHLRYEQPASFYLKAPTLLYVFIFIALRALRFEARFVLLTGIVASLGWLVLTLYVLYADPADNMMTRDYVAYLTSNSVLLGAEFDKVISILIVSGIIAVAIFRAKSLLVRAVSEQTAAQDLSRFFAPEVAARIKGAEKEITAGSGEMRDAAILNLDLRGFTKFAGEASPDEVMRLLADYQRAMVPVIRKHGGSIDKFLGDGIMATFGASQPSESHAADALRALDEAMEVAKRWQAEAAIEGGKGPQVNGAVATGSVLFGAVGDDARLEYTVIGDAVNLSAKLEKHNKAAGSNAICDQATFDAALQQGYTPQRQKRMLPGSAVEGVAHPIDLVVID